MRPRCSKRISVRPSPRSVRSTLTSSSWSSPGWEVIVKIRRSGAVTSWYRPRQRLSRRAGPQYTVARQAPPGRTSIETVESGTSHSTPPNQSAKQAGSVHSRHTRSRAAARTRVVVKPPVPNGAGSVICSQPFVHAVEASLPEGAVVIEPFGRVLQRHRAQARGAQLRGAPPFDQAGALEHAQVLADRLGAHRERRRQLVDGGLALHEAREDRPPRGIGERGERRAELVDGHGAKPSGLIRIRDHPDAPARAD